MSPSFSSPISPCILAIAASTSLCSLSLKKADETYHWQSNQANQHSEQLLPAIAALLLQAGIHKPDLIAVDIGPGAFTSIRVACGVAQGLSLGWACPVLPVQSLTALAYQALYQNGVERSTRIETVCAVLDARMSECYISHYTLNNTDQTLTWIQATPPKLMACEKISNFSVDALIGNAGVVLPQWSSLAPVVIDAAPSSQGVLAAAIAQLQGGEEPFEAGYLQPLYIRDQVAYTSAQRLAGVHNLASNKVSLSVPDCTPC